ncbi:MAG: DUF1501 domain-containing protein [Mariniblastus sp.]|nr:DUF1501 domain-containing protein [Mariniblastus sp.]
MNNRRNFLKQSLAGSAVISLSGAVPDFLLGTSRKIVKKNDDKILVVVQMSGGNDGLNTVVPYGDDEYYRNRFTLAIGKSNVLKVNDHIGFHPGLTGFDRLMNERKMSIVQGVGYPNPNRSHFESMDLWHTAHQTSSDGWLGRSVETSLASENLPAIHFGSGLQPLALKTSNKPVPSIRSIDNFRLNVLRDEKVKKQLAAVIKAPRKTDNALLGYVHESATVALETSLRLQDFGDKQNGEFKYPQSNLGKNLSTIAQLIESGLSTRIYYTTLDGFDTHSNQGESHRSLLSDLGNSVEAFMKQIEAQGNLDRVVLFSFSEFGRRVRENASRGTDHGTAAPVFLFGSKLKQPVVGEHPSLQDLEQGDLKFQIDYRSVYCDLLTNWMEIDPRPVVGKNFQTPGLFD